MIWLTLAVLTAALATFTLIGLRAARSGAGLDDFVTARNSQGAATLGLSFLASGMGAWILFVPPEVGAFVGPVAVAGYALGAALPFAAFALFGRRVRHLLPRGRSLGEFARLRFGAVMHRWVVALSVLYMLCFVTAELTAVGSITALLTGLDGRYLIAAVAAATLVYTAFAGLRASLTTDRWQAWLLLALIVLVIGYVAATRDVGAIRRAPTAPLGDALGVALTLIIAVTAANLFHQGYWQRLWAARDDTELGRGAIIGMVLTIGVVLAVGLLGVLAAGLGVDPGTPPLPLFALLAEAPAWLALPAALLGVTLVASSVDTLENALVSIAVAERPGMSLAAARWITVALMVPVVLVAMQGISVLRLFLVADLLCATAVMPVLLGLWRRVPTAAALAGSVAGLAGAIIPGWYTGGGLTDGLRLATFPAGVPTLAPFAGALLASTLVALAATALFPRRDQPRP